MTFPRADEPPRDEDQSKRPAIDPDAGGDDFAAEHEDTGTEPAGTDAGEPESPDGRSGLEPRQRPN